MHFNIQAHDEAGNITFNGTLTQNEASYVMTIGINYLLAKGADLGNLEAPEEDVAVQNAPSTNKAQ
jgi:hypothetical protein